MSTRLSVPLKFATTLAELSFFGTTKSGLLKPRGSSQISITRLSSIFLTSESFGLVELPQFVLGAPEDVGVPDTELGEFMKLALVRVIFGELELFFAFQEAQELRRSRVRAWRRLKLHRRSFRIVGSGHVGEGTRCGSVRGGRSSLRGIPGITIVLLDVQSL